MDENYLRTLTFVDFYIRQVYKSHRWFNLMAGKIVLF